MTYENSLITFKIKNQFYFYINRSSNDSFFVIEEKYYQHNFRDSKQVRAYTLDDLVGMIGGYLGLFLGYALVQIPLLVSILLKWTNRLWEKNISRNKIDNLTSQHQTKDTKSKENDEDAKRTEGLPKEEPVKKNKLVSEFFDEQIWRLKEN